MKRYKSLVRLSKEHHDGLILAQFIKKGAPPYKGMPTDLNGKKDYTITFFENYLIKHFDDEENILMATLKNKDEQLDKLFDQMLREHIELKSLINKIKTEENFEDLLNEFGFALESHIRMEERELFERIQQVFDESTLNNLVDKLI
ncbi:hemerythrin domain-containing protein [Rosettibacter firmus]|uniref:hemerythrin domain-containing protein n=1 Tax=Rosettibacter firmus TaxID=3111522 RepID=UPI00336C1FBA